VLRRTPRRPLALSASTFDGSRRTRIGMANL
jgi:hypothetical protein